MQKWRELPGFRTYRDFFADLPRGYENVVPSDVLKRSLIDAIPKIELIDDDSDWFDKIRQEPSDLIDSRMSEILDDWHESAVVREVRQFPTVPGREGVFAFGSETYYVRFEVASLYPRGAWGSPIALMMVADAFYRPMSYTFIYGNGRLQNGVNCRSCYGAGDSPLFPRISECKGAEAIRAALALLRVRPLRALRCGCGAGLPCAL